MNFKPILLPIVAVCLGGSLQAQTPPSSSPAPSASPGVAEHRGGWHHHHGGWLLRKLQLTDTQRQQLTTYRTQNQTAFRSALVNYLQAKTALQNAISQNNTGNLAGLAANVATAKGQLIQLHAQQEAYLVSILQPDQKNVWDQIQAIKASRLQDRISKLQGQ